MRILANSKGGYCLSTEYINSKTKLKWECAEGHRWHAKLNSIQQGRWCMKCSGSEKKSIQEMQEIAIARGGYCLSTEYINNKTKLSWECNEGHRWHATPNSIQRGSWCMKCSGKEKKSIQEMRDLAKSRGGDCLSEVYVNMNTKLLWECAKGHIWHAVPNSILQGHWCAVCARN